MPLAMSYAEEQFALGKELWMCACRGDDYTPDYFAPTQTTWLDLIRASSAIHFIAAASLLDGISYLDGGVSDAIPTGGGPTRAQTIVVIRTVPSQMFYTRGGLSEWSVGWGKQPAAVCEPGPASRGHLSHYPTVY